MPLTPNDVHNVVFNKPPVGKRGYDEDEVDAFLDLIEENLIERDDTINDLQKQVEDLRTQLENAEANGNGQTSSNAATEPASDADYNAAVSVLRTAQETANKVVSEANTMAEDIKKAVAEEKERILSETNAKSKEILEDAESRGSARVKEAEEKANALESDAERKHNEIMSSINQRRGILESKIDQLQAFEKEYHNRLKSTFESQLAELEKMYSVAPKE